jgi:hypothetical protein
VILSWRTVGKNYSHEENVEALAREAVLSLGLRIDTCEQSETVQDLCTVQYSHSCNFPSQTSRCYQHEDTDKVADTYICDTGDTVDDSIAEL